MDATLTLTLTLSQEQLAHLKSILYFAIQNEETDYEETLEEFGPNSPEAMEHIFAKATNLLYVLENY